MAETKIRKLEEIVKPHVGKKFVISGRGVPDPDSIACSFAHQKILKHFGIESTIIHVEEISHQQNRAMVKLLGFDLLKIEENNLNFEDFTGYSLVDSQFPDDMLITPLKKIPLISVVDHHITEREINSEFQDIQTAEIGAASTIYSEYLRELELLQPNFEFDKRLATALMHGIRTDIGQDLLKAQPRDYESLAYLSKYADSGLLKKISEQNLSEKTMKTIADAFDNRIKISNYSMAGVGIIKPSERDAIPQSADWLLLEAGVNTALVYAIIKSNGKSYIDCSFRTNDDGVSPHEWIKQAFLELKDEGVGTYGGRGEKGGFKISLGIFASLIDKDPDTLVKITDSYMKNRYYEKLGFDETEVAQKENLE